MLKSKIESLLFISPKPLSIKKIKSLLNKDDKEIKAVLEDLMKEYNQKEKGLCVIRIGESYQMTTNGDNAQLVQEFLKEEITGELTRPSLETLTIVAYRGPISKFELEQIRGVNCSLILRNLMMRGLIDAREDKKKMQTYYNITFDFLRFLGLTHTEKLPNYEKLHGNDILNKMLGT